LKKDFDESYKNIILPKYKFDDRLKINREVNKPPLTIFMELGHNETAPLNPEEDKKHYRRYYPDELENNTDIFKESPFYTTDIVRG
jgi:hypothetical protein